MKYLILLILFMSCYAPNKTLYEFRYVRLIEIHKSELGFDLFWKDNVRIYNQFVKDTSGSDLFIGMSVITLMPK